MQYLQTFGGCIFLLLLTSLANAQTVDNEPKSFDLFIFGQNLDTNTTNIWLKENPGLDNNWKPLSNGITQTTNEGYVLLMFDNLSAEQFAGQDIRENYISIKVTNDGTEPARIRAMYALPHFREVEKHLAQLVKVIKLQPQQLRQHSLASTEFPLAQTVLSNKEWIEHIEMSVRHLKPGIQEVKWLDVIFSEN